jgi:hypothetical protein
MGECDRPPSPAAVSPSCDAGPVSDERHRVPPGIVTQAEVYASGLKRDGRHLYRTGERYEITRGGQTIAAGLTLVQVRREVESLAGLLTEHQAPWQRQAQWEREAG